MHMSTLKTIEEDKIDTPPSYDAKDITQGGKLAHIVLDKQVYTLRITRAGKLILTKWSNMIET